MSALRIALGIGAAVAMAAGARAIVAHRAHRAHRGDASAGAARTMVHVPRTDAKMVVDGDLDEPGWRASVRRIFVKQDGSEGRPYSDVRLVRSGDTLHVGLYASDHDIVTAHVGHDGPVWRGDDFHVVFTVEGASYAFDVDPKCTITDARRTGKGAWDYRWESGARAACDSDGTVDHPGDNDEEWVVEMDVPLAALGLGASGASAPRALLDARRCDVKEAGGKPLETPCPRIEPLVIVFD